jgi:FkbM family methyltransferase
MPLREEVRIRERLARAYVAAFGWPRMQPVNHAMYQLALRGMGYNNGWQLPRSGEQWFIRNVLAPTHPRVCVDVGANKGDYTAELLRWTTAQVHAFEPLPGAFECLREIADQSPGRVFLNNCAVGASSEPALIHYGDADSELASLSAEVSDIAFVGAANTNVMEVQVTTLDEHFTDLVRHGPGAIDFIKVDTEGFEFEVLQGAREVVAACRPRFVQIEMNLHQMVRRHTLYSLHELMGDSYDVFQLLPHGMHQVDAKRPESNTFSYSNFVFARRDLD